MVKFYEHPEIEIHELCSEGMLCASNEIVREETGSWGGVLPAVAALLMMSLFPSCTAEVEMDVPSRSNVYYAGIETVSEVKTYLDEESRVRWSAGDRIVLFEKNDAPGLFEIDDASAGKTSGTFTSLVPGTDGNVLDHNVAFYPYCEAGCVKAGEDSYLINVNLPSEQSYAIGGFSEGMFPMVAVSDDNELTFRNVCGGVKLMIKGNAQLKSITLWGNDNEYLSGSADVVMYAGDRLPEVRMQDSASKYVKLDCNSAALDPDVSTAFVLTMPPVEFEKGFIVTIQDVSGNVMTVSATVQNTVRRSTLLKMPEFTFVPSAPETKVLTECPFKRGINISDWMLHDTETYVKSAGYIEKDFRDLKELGFDAVRLPVDFKSHVGNSPDYIIPDYLLHEIDKAVNYAENAGLYIIIDNHSYLGESFPNEGPAVLKKVFAQIAERYKDRSDKVMYELFNEPNGSDLSLKLLWGTLQPALIDIIRSVDKRHTIIVSGFGSGIEYLESIKSLKERDKNLIYTFHFYSPALFTHQGAAWSGSPMQYLSSPVPFPYDASLMPAKPDQFVGSYNEEDFDTYPSRGNVGYLKERLQIAVDFARNNDVPVYCGEWGVLNVLAAQEDYCNYHKVVREMFEENDISWTLWAYRDDFNIFNRGSARVFENDLNVGLLEALDLNVPAGYTSQMPAEIVFYDDVAASFVKESCFNNEAAMTFESRYAPFSGERCMDWTIGGRYASVTFEMWPVADFSAQASKSYELSFMVRCDKPLPASLTVRFVEYYEQDGTSYVWRNAYLLNNNAFDSDGEWHEVRIPMSQFINMGGYKGSEWQNQDMTRSCDWTKINKLEFAAEGQSSLTGLNLYFDDIRIVKSEGKWHTDGFVMNPVRWEW